MPRRRSCDHRQPVSLADIEIQVAFSLEMRDQISDITDVIERMEHTRLQLAAAAGALATDEDASAVHAEVQRLSGIATTLSARLTHTLPRTEIRPPATQWTDRADPLACSNRTSC